MFKTITAVAAFLLLLPLTAQAQDGKAGLEAVAKALKSYALAINYDTEEKLLSEADVYNPAPPNTPPPAVVNPNSVNLADNLTRLGLAVDNFLPLHGRMVPLAELNRAIGR